MSLLRTLLNELRPSFRLFDDISHSASVPFPVVARRGLFDNFPSDPFPRKPAIDISEQDNNYIIEAELPGVKKENLEVRVGDNGRTVTIEGKIFTRSKAPTVQASSMDPVQQPSTTNTEAQLSESPPALSTEREFSSSSHFSRTVWLPQAIDASNVSGHLEDGVLMLRIPRAGDQGSVKVQIQ